MAKEASINSKNPLLRLIQGGLEFWIKQQCKTIDNLSIYIEGNIFNILKGNVNSVNVVAKNVNFKNILISKAIINTSPIKVSLRAANSQQRIQLSEFSIRGKLILDSADINSIVFSKSWVKINNLICNKLLDNSNITSVTIYNDLLKIGHSSNKQSELVKSFEVLCNSASIELRDTISKNKLILPMDESVRIVEANIEGNYLEISLESIVK